SYETLQTTSQVEQSTPPLVLHLNRMKAAPAPTGDSVVSVQELRLSGKAESLFAKGTTLLQKGQPKRSLTYFRRAIAKDAGYYRAYHNLGLASYQLGQIEDAKQAFQKSIDLTNGGYAPSQFALGMIFCEQRQFRDAERVIQNALLMDPGSA